ncbi:hypothetical protein [Saccharolobus shibatae]|nr:hypothetical protein [Saccharolobus shibatae]
MEIKECILFSASIYLYTYFLLIGFEENEIKTYIAIIFQNIYLLKVAKRR